jgi:hypothetical protein
MVTKLAGSAHREKAITNFSAMASMATKKCWQCGTDLDKSSKECPICKALLGSVNARGYANTLEEERKTKIEHFLNVLYLVVFGTFFLLGTGTVTEACWTKDASSPARQATIELIEINNAYREDPIAASEKYGAPTDALRFRGSVIEVSKMLDGEQRMFIALYTGRLADGFVPAGAYFSIDQEAEIMSLVPGQVATFEGRLQEYGGDGRLTFRDCKLLRRRVVVTELEL